uniref:RHS repeat-associated core domain-containing protein n=1 Tax=Coprobacter fastidiosus TaxID=1099853 RepID=UPI003AB72F33
GEVVQHIEYVPFGEVFIEERNSIWNTPYLFNAKEFDEETGLYYYGARYYDPRLSLWISTDPFIVTNKFYSDNIKENINGGVYNPFNLNAYTQCWQNPIRYKDDDGNAITPETAWDIINVVMGATSFAGNVVSGNVLGAVLDGIGLIYDGAATAIPVLPAGASSALGTYRFARATNKVIGAINKLGDLRPFKNSQKMQNLLGKANNAISDHLNISDIAGAVQDILGIPIKNGDKVYSHISEVNDAMRSLTKLKSELTNTLKSAGLTESEIKQVSNTIKEIDSHMNRINKILNKAHEIAD